VSPVKYELGFYIPEEDILHSHRRENLKSHIFTLHCSCAHSAVLTAHYNGLGHSTTARQQGAIIVSTAAKQQGAVIVSTAAKQQGAMIVSTPTKQ
jgi:hypothetical protein